MNKEEFLAEVAGKAGLDDTELERVWQLIVETMVEAFRREESLDLGEKLGRFDLRVSPAGRGIGGGTARVANAERRAVIFKSGKEFKKTINQTTKL